jgi:hypothetical protein
MDKGIVMGSADDFFQGEWKVWQQSSQMQQ